MSVGFNLFVFLASVVLSFSSAFGSDGISENSRNPADYAIQLESDNGLPDTKVYVFLRQEHGYEGLSAEEQKDVEQILTPLVRGENGQILIRISVYTETPWRKTEPRRAVFDDLKTGISLPFEATCRCLATPLVTHRPYEYTLDTLSRVYPLTSLYLIGPDGKEYGPYAVRPTNVMALKPISAFALQSVIGQERNQRH